MVRKLIIFISSLLVIGAIGLFLLPNILQYLGLHPNYKGKKYDLKGYKALIITTSHDKLGDGKPTGVYASEMTAPYYEFLDANMQVDVASVNGGKIPIEPMSLKWPLAMNTDKRYLEDKVFQQKTEASLKIDDLDFANYDIIFLAGGWGAAFDLGTSEVLGQKMTDANKSNKVFGGICHGPLGLLKAKDSEGNPLIKGRKLTAVTNKQVTELGITSTPQHPERELRAAGALFESHTAFRDFFADLTIVDGNLVTGQNQNAGKETAQKMMEVLQKNISKK